MALPKPVTLPRHPTDLCTTLQVNPPTGDHPVSSARQTEHPIHPLFTQRWSPRAFTGEAISEEQLLMLLEAARWAPSAYNAQPWRWIHVRRDTAHWAPIFESLVEFNQGWAQHAAALLVLVSAKQAVFPGKPAAAPNAWHSFDSGAAWASLAFQATLSGLASHAMAGFDEPRLREAIQLPETHAIETVIAVGKPGRPDRLPEALLARENPNGRLPLADVAFEGRFKSNS